MSPRHQNSRESEIVSFCGCKERNRENEKGEKEDDDHEEEEGDVRKFNFSEIGYISTKKQKTAYP